MFRTAVGFKAQYHFLTLLVASDFDEWRIILQGPGLTIHGCRQFSEAKAKQHAIAVAGSYFEEQKREDLPALAEIDWTPLQDGEWLNWRT